MSMFVFLTFSPLSYFAMTTSGAGFEVSDIIIIIIYSTETIRQIEHIIYTHTNIVWNC